MSSNSRPSSTQSSQGPTYPFAIGRLLLTRPVMKLSTPSNSRELMLRTLSQMHRPLRKCHPYKRTRYTSSHASIEPQQPLQDDIRRFLEAIAVLARNDQQKHDIPEPQPWYVTVFDFFVAVPMKVRESRAVQFIFPAANNQ
ncbi:hypothetical protein D9758_010514 [Tetrapyrgos nigripes]|uniref:Uncharacterized protein n=1 Tax=Tetrapyrgos nigripes TaxID=182062 RepID=A0A8H5D1A1_9AGAR|nr:hypothetical protein D9758_010514 [Tetrapyrgos nigripes]